ncbi:hypothetical protein Droror1_Dr00015563 [Drosera rotundifolia]
MTKVAATTSSNSSVSGGLTSLLKLLPTGTVFIFQFLSPVLSNNGKCHTLNKIFMSVLIGVSGLACALGSFTDSFTDGKTTYYGIATLKGLWTSGSKEKSNDPDYAIQAGDFVHAGLSLLVFATVAVLDSNTVDCFFPSLKSSENTFMAVLPVVIGAIASLVFYFFPSKREGIGYASTTTSTTTTSSTSTKSSSDASKEASKV